MKIKTDEPWAVRPAKAKRFAEEVKDFQPIKGYDYALRDIIDCGLSVK